MPWLLIKFVLYHSGNSIFEVVYLLMTSLSVSRTLCPYSGREENIAGGWRRGYITRISGGRENVLSLRISLLPVLATLLYPESHPQWGSPSSRLRTREPSSWLEHLGPLRLWVHTEALRAATEDKTEAKGPGSWLPTSIPNLWSNIYFRKDSF